MQQHAGAAVAPSDMEGYRPPTWEERGAMTGYMEKEKKREGRIQLGWEVFFWIVCVAGIFGGLGAEGLKLTVFYLVLGLVFGAAACGCMASRKHGRQLVEATRKGDFSVMDCRAYDADLGADGSTGSAVMVENARGQRCRDRFLVDYKSARAWYDGNRDMPFKLFRCDCGNGRHTFKLFSDAMLHRYGGKNRKRGKAESHIRGRLSEN